MKVGSKLVALITGGASGLGAATARRLHQHGAKIAIVDRDELLMDKMKHELKTNVFTAKCDVTDHLQVKSAVDATVN
jgi:NAD(P)-dependent dehydrogenase (short-subunit alcohol dehydrogenase family)